MQKEILIKSVKKGLGGVVKLPHQASCIAYEIFLLIYALNLEDDPEVTMLVAVFANNLSEWGMEDLLNHQVDYAIRLADSAGKLEYEEMHKLFSLCDEIFALEFLGFEFNSELMQDFEKSVKKRFSQEKKKAKLVAEDKVEDWQKEFWWYKENMG